MDPCEILEDSNRMISKTLSFNDTNSNNQTSTYYFHWVLNKSEGKYIDPPRKNITFIASACTGKISLSVSPPLYFPLTSENNQYENWTVNGTNGGDLKITLSLDFAQYFLAISGEENSSFLITYIIRIIIYFLYILILDDKGELDLGNNGEIIVNSTKNQENYVPTKDTPQKQLIHFYRNKINDTNKIKFYLVSIRHIKTNEISCGLLDSNKLINKKECITNSYCGISYIQQNQYISKHNESIVNIYEVKLKNESEKFNNSISIKDENSYSNNDSDKISYYIPDLMFDDVYSFNVIMEYDGKYNFSYNGGYGMIKLDWSIYKNYFIFILYRK